MENRFILLHALKEAEADSSEVAHSELFDLFERPSSPTVLIATAQGIEIDRLVGYHSQPDAFKNRLAKIYKGENTFLRLTQELEKDPDNQENLANLSYKYYIRHDYKAMAQCGEKVLREPEKARKIQMTLRDGKKVSAYEYALFARAYSGPGNILAFLNEFPSSQLCRNAIGFLRNHVRQADKQKDALEVCRSLIAKYPDDSNLLDSYIIVCAKLKMDVDQGIAAAEYFNRNHPHYFSSQGTTAQAELLLMKGEDTKAIQIMDRWVAVSIESKFPYGLKSYAQFWALKGKNLNNAETAVRKALEFEDNPSFWDTLSMVLWKQGKHAEAIAAEEKALQLAGGKNEDYQKRIEEIKMDMNK